MDLLKTFEKRRTNYIISNKKIISTKRVESIVAKCVKAVPSAFNSQSARVVLLFDDQHTKLWDIVLDSLRKIVPSQNFQKTEDKVNSSFKSGFGTILFFEDIEVTQNLQKAYPTYSENFPVWAEQSNGMLQFAIWTALANEGLGVSLQHYNPLIDVEVKKKWNVPNNFKLIAQMPFGNPLKKPLPKEFKPIEERMKTYR